MSAYATVTEVAAGFRELDADEQSRAEQLLEEAAILINAAAPNASEDAKSVVSRRMVRRALGDSSTAAMPLGANQGSVAAGGYSQSWTIGSGGSTGELYLSRIEKALLGIGNRIGARSPLEGCDAAWPWRQDPSTPLCSAQDDSGGADA